MGAYDLSRIKSSLLHFGIGKLASGLTGLVLLLVLVRALPAQDYAFMVALLATFEITTLALNFGVLPATWRYLPEARSKGSARNVMLVAAGSIAARAVPLLIAALVLTVFPQGAGHWLGFGIDDAAQVIRVFAVVLFAEAMTRHIDLVFELLLMQRLSQALIWLRATARVIGMLVLTHGLNETTTILHWVTLEAMVSLTGLAAGVALCIKSIVLPARTSALTIPLPSPQRIWAFAGPAYLSQVLGAVQGLDACKLMAAQFASASVVTAFGFVTSLAATLQRYLPSYLLLGFVRPLFVHTNLSEGGNGTSQSLASMLLKLNLLVLLPAFGCALVIGNELVGRLSGGRVIDSGALLAMTCVVLCAQVLHMILGLLALSVEESLSGLKGTTIGALVFGAAAWNGEHIGVFGLLMAVVLCEAAWCSAVLYAIRRKGSDLPVNWGDYGKLALAGAIATGLGLAVARLIGGGADQRISLVLVVGAAGFLGAVVALRPLNDGERHVMRKLVPSRFLVI
jgi:O-antigen/teichoic acid export membrane protein